MAVHVATVGKLPQDPMPLAGQTPRGPHGAAEGGPGVAVGTPSQSQPAAQVAAENLQGRLLSLGIPYRAVRPPQAQ